MTDVKQKQLANELAYYKSLLKKYESSARINALQSSAQQLQNSSWKQPALPTYEMVKNSSQFINSSKHLYSSSKLHHNAANHNKLIPNTNKRTVLYNQNKYFKAQPGVSSQTSENVKYSDSKVVSKRTVINGTYSNSSRKVILNNENNSRKVILASNNFEKATPPDSEDLLKEIEFLTQLLENSSENKLEAISNAKSITSVKNSANNVVVHKNIFDNESLNKVNPTAHQNINECNITPMTVTVNFRSSSLNTQNSMCHTNLSSKNKFMANVSTPYPPKSSNTSKYSLKKVGVQQTLYSKINHPSKVPVKVEKLNILNNCNSDSQSVGKILYSDSQVNKLRTDIVQHHNSVHEPKAIALDKLKLDKKSTIVNGPVYKLVNERSPVITKVKSPIVSKVKCATMLKEKSYSVLNAKSPVVFKIKSPGVSKVAKSRTVYTKINQKHVVTPKRKQQFKNSFVYHKTIPVTKMKSMNSKYKVINKIDSTNLSKKLLKKQNSSESKENSVLIGKSESFELLDDSAIENLEQRLMAISTSLTATPKPVFKHGQNEGKVLPRSSNSKVNSKFYQKTPLRKPKVLSSKYKVVNKNGTNKVDSKLCVKKTKYKVVNKNLSPQRSSLKRRNSTVLKSPAKKVVSSKFSIVNKHSSVNITPAFKGKSILIKRLYKSKSTIINKNDNSVSHSAKLIKSKYLGLNKRKSPSFQKHVLYPKMPLRLQRFKGHFKTSRLNTNLNRYEKSATLLYSKGARRFSKYSSCTTSRRYTKNDSRTCLKRKLNGYGQSPVLVIRGTRYSRSSGGKTLRRLPSKGQTQTVKTPNRIFIDGKSYVRTSANVMKVASPVSVNLASRVLHRSINRVLTASSKRSLTKVNTYCMFYNRFGRCNRGVKCTYIHDPSKIAVCTRFLRGTCKIEGCPFSHEVTPGKMAICSFFLVGACEKNDCPYRHEQLSPNAVLCKAFVQGYCPNGKECKKAHILICPKFILGECEKGSSCAFPHPPQKVKKTVQKDTMEENELKKEEDILLEKVARYFQPLCPLPLTKNIPEENDTIKLFVPKQRKLEEQPAFIPLTDAPVTSRLEQSE